MSDESHAAYRFATTFEEVRGVTWDLDGVELTHEQTIQRLAAAGFGLYGGALLKMFAIIEGESGEYTKAWHINVAREPEGAIVRDSQGRMTVKSIDLGFIQRNVNVTDFQCEMDPDLVGEFVLAQFEAHPELAVPWSAAEAAYELYADRGFQPWYAYRPGTEAFALKMRYGAKAIANYVAHKFVDPKASLDWT